MTYTLPDWGIWSEDKQVMLESGLTDLEYAKKRVWTHFDAGDESVMVVPSCPQHPDRQVTSTHRKGLGACRRLTDGGIEHFEEWLARTKQESQR